MSDGQSRSERLQQTLDGLLAQTPELEAAAVVSFDGLAMASALPPGMEEDRVAAMSAALLSLGERASEGLGRGELSQVYIEGRGGTVFLVSADGEAVLVAVAGAAAKAGLVLFELRRAATRVADVLRVSVEPAFAAAPVTEPSYHEPLPVQPVYADVLPGADPLYSDPVVPAQPYTPVATPATPAWNYEPSEPTTPPAQWS